MFVSVCGMLSRHARHAHPRANDFFNSRQQLHDVLMQLAQECKLMGVGIVLDNSRRRNWIHVHHASYCEYCEWF